MPAFKFPTQYSFTWLLLILTLMTPLCSADTSPAQIMSRAMLSMMDTMGDLAHQYKRRDNWNYGNSWNRYGSHPPSTITTYPGDYYPGQPPLPYEAAPYYQNQTQSEVDGIWIGRNGEIVLVMYGYFRIYADAETYHDGRYRIDDDLLLMQDPETGKSQQYQFALDSGRMIMRDRYGNYLLFKQLPIPVPPYALIPQNEPTKQPEADSE
ncbi:MAG: hypothetical protein ABW170_15970 [Candidatus Thiodiazotropha sp. L084R]